MEEHEITLSEYWRIIRKRRLTIIFVLSITFVSTVIFTKMQTPIYQASMELKVEKQQANFATSSKEQVISIAMPWEDVNLATELRLIKSLPIMQKVVERMEVLPPEGEEREKAIHSLSLSYQSRISLSQIESTNIIAVQVIDSNPEKAALIASAVADVYIVENVEARRRQSKAIIEYINKQLDEYERQLREKEESLQKFKQNEKVFEVTPSVKQILDRMTVAGTFEFEANMTKIEEEINKIDRSLTQSEANEILNALSSNFVFTGLQRRLLELEFERFLLLIDYTEKHPSVVAQDEIIASVKDKIVEMMKGSSRAPLTIEAEGDLSLIVKRLFLSARREVLYRIINRFYEEAGSLSSNQIEYLGLKRAIERIVSAFDALILQRDEVNLNLAKVIDDVITVVTPPGIPGTPIKPNAGMNYLVSFVVGLLLGILVAFIQESMDTSVTSIADVEKEMELSILGIIPHMRIDELIYDPEEEQRTKDKKLFFQKARLVTIMDPKSWPAESIKMLRTNLVQIAKSRNIKTILFTSSDKQEGKSTIVTNLVLSLAQLGKKVVLLGSNMRRPTIYKIFGLEREPGLADILMGNITWREAINTSTDILVGGLNIDKLLHMPGIDNLKIITAGRPVDNVSELLNSKAYDQLLRELKAHFDFVIIDCSPVMAVPDAITLSDKVDGLVMVYKVGHTSKDVLRMAKSNLLHAKANILGIVLNNIKTEAQVGYSAYYYRQYTEDEKKQKRKSADQQKESASKVAAINHKSNLF